MKKQTPDCDLAAVGELFTIPGDFVSGAPYGSGHINDTFAVVYNQGGSLVRYIQQRINTHVFRDTYGLMDNIRRVTEHTRRKLHAGGITDISRRTLTLIPAKDGEPMACNPLGEHWRTYIFVEQAKTYNAIESEHQAFEAAKAFGAFQRQLVDLDGPRLNETIPNFHHTRSRYDALEEAIAKDISGRAASVQKEIDFARARENMVDTLLDLQAGGVIPERITHNDTKLNNVMLDDKTGEGLCVIDLDTVMPGLVLYDFGDLVRTSTSPAPEDERDLAKVVMQLDMFAALVKGYLAAAGAFLIEAEREHLAFSGRLITFEIGLRFLTDHLEGDKYFKIHRPGHNLDRCRTQFALVQNMEEQEDAMRKIVMG